MKKLFTLAFSLFFALIFSQGILAQTCEDGDYQWSDVLAIFDNNGCTTSICHGGEAAGLDLTTFAGFSEGGTKCSDEISSGTTLVDIIVTGATCDDGMVPAMNDNLATSVPQADIDAIQTWIDEGAFELCTGVGTTDRTCTPASTIDVLNAPAQTSICADGSDAPLFAVPTTSLPDVQIAIEVNGVLADISADGTFDTASLAEGDEVCYTGFSFDLVEINSLLNSANGLCGILDCDMIFEIPGLEAAITELVNGDNDGNPGLNDLNEALTFAGSFGTPIQSVQSAAATLVALNLAIGGFSLGPVCFATTDFVCFPVATCGPCSGSDVEVVFSVDMSCSGTTERPPVVTGPFNGFSGDANVMTDPDGDDIWEATICAAPGADFEYKYAILNFTEQENLIDDVQGGASCAPVTDFFSYANREITIPTGGGALPTDAYGICGDCSNPPLEVTFMMDLNCSNIPDGTTLAITGGFNGFCDGCAPMDDSDGDGIWEISYVFPPDANGCYTVNYLYQAPNWSNAEDFLNNGEDLTACDNIDTDFSTYANRSYTICQNMVIENFWNTCSNSLAAGCTDPAYCEYDPDAVCDDSSLCLTPNTDPGSCNNDCFAGDIEVWDPATCTCEISEVSIFGCTDLNACNFDVNANCDNGTCVFTQDCDDGDCTNGLETWDTTTCSCVNNPPTGATGCTDPAFCEYDPLADCDDGSCTTSNADPGTCDDGECSNGLETWNTATCSCVENPPSGVTGCTDATYCEYDPAADCDDGSCVTSNVDPGTCDDGDCANGLETWETTTCSCVNNSPSGVTGCTDATYCEYDPAADCDDGSCVTSNTEPGTCDDGDCTNGLEIWDEAICLCLSGTPPDTNCDDGDCSTNDTFDVTTCSCENIPITCSAGEFFNPQTCLCESSCTVTGCTDSNACNYNPNACEDDGSCIITLTCDDGDCTTNDFFDTAGCACEFIPITCPNGEFFNPQTCICEANTCVVLGCMDSNACNYNPNACEDDGSCIDFDMICDDGDCSTNDFFDTAGCACDFIPITCPNGEFFNPQTCVCESNTCVVAGCMDSNACNYNPNACEDDGSCIDFDMICDDGDCSTNDFFDTAGCGCDFIPITCPNGEFFNPQTCICEAACTVAGCMDSNACNFNPNACEDDGSCGELIGATCTDNNGNSGTLDSNCQCAVDAILGCTNATACNFDTAATADDGSCKLPGDACNDFDSCTTNDILLADCSCAGVLLDEDQNGVCDLVDIATVPTMGEWGLLLLSLLLLNFVCISFLVSNLKLQGFNNQTINYFHWKNLNSYPFQLNVFKKALKITLCLLPFIWCLIITVYGFVTFTDIIGLCFTIPVLAYLLHLLIMANDNKHYNK